MSQHDLAMKAGYKHQSGIANLENRATGTGGNKIGKIATALNISVEWLIAGPDSENVPFLPGIATPNVNYTTLAAEPEVAHNVVHVRHTIRSTSEYDPWTNDAIQIMLGLQVHERVGALANLRAYVHGLGPPSVGQTVRVAG